MITFIRLFGGGLYTAMGTPAVLAVTTDNGLPLWGQLGIAAVFVMGFVTLQIVPGVLYKKLQEELKEERTYSRQLEETIKTQVLPLMIKYVDATETMVDFLRENYPAGKRPRKGV